MATNDWTKFLVPQKERILPPRRRLRGIVSYGPEELGLRKRVRLGGGPEEFTRNNPQLFATSATSRYEGFAYWALLKILGPERQINASGIVWYYQSEVAPFGRAGSAIVDFTVDGVLTGWILGIRISSYFHTNLGSAKAGLDFAQISFLIDQSIYPIDVDGEKIVMDRSGKSAILEMQRAINITPQLSALYKSH